MYGLLLENLSQYISKTYGNDKWEKIRRQAGIDQPTFSTHEIYPDDYFPKLTQHACEILNVTEKELLFNAGVLFVSFIGIYGYDKILSVLGRELRDFLNGLDNLHEYLIFSYPKMKPPSFFCNNETENGLTLHYRSKRRGFLWYSAGLITEIARYFYNKNVKVELLSETMETDELHYVLQLTFDNSAFLIASEKQQATQALEKTKSNGQQITMIPINAKILLQIFPFCIVFDHNLLIKAVGTCLKIVMPNILNSHLAQEFLLQKPKIGYNWHAISGHTNTIFELTSVQPLKRQIKNTPIDRSNKLKVDQKSLQNNNNDFDDNDINKQNGHDYELLNLKGQMLYMDEWKSMVYLAAPNMRDLDALIQTGLYINDLSLHDFSRDIVLVGPQQSAELKLALDQELHKSEQLKDSMRKLDVEMKRTDELLYQMIPKIVADRLRKGESALNTCQYYPNVTILFSDIVNFTGICSLITPMQVVTMLNSMYSLFDQLTEKYQVYKVETIGDAYMVAGGLPVLKTHHANSTKGATKVCELALEMINVVYHLEDPSTGNNLRIRIGVHSGVVVGGVVGIKMPRYCLFGDTVNTASRIESSSEAQMVQISEMTKGLIDHDKEWNIYERGTIKLKGKGYMKTYWLYGRKNPNQMNNRIKFDGQNENENEKLIMKIDNDNHNNSENWKMCYNVMKKSNTMISCTSDGTFKQQSLKLKLPRKNSLPDARTLDYNEKKLKSSSTEQKDMNEQRKGVSIDEVNKILINDDKKPTDKFSKTTNYDHETNDILEQGYCGCFCCGPKGLRQTQRRKIKSCEIV